MADVTAPALLVHEGCGNAKSGRSGRGGVKGGRMSALETMMPPVSYAAVNGVEIAYYEAGPREGVPIVLCHGFPELAFSWRMRADSSARRGPPSAGRK